MQGDSLTSHGEARVAQPPFSSSYCWRRDREGQSLPSTWKVWLGKRGWLHGRRSAYPSLFHAVRRVPSFPLFVCFIFNLLFRGKIGSQGASQQLKYHTMCCWGRRALSWSHIQPPWRGAGLPLPLSEGFNDDSCWRKEEIGPGFPPPCCLCWKEWGKLAPLHPAPLLCFVLVRASHCSGKALQMHREMWGFTSNRASFFGLF